MISLRPDVAGSSPTHVLCLGAHSDDIEIGCGGTILSMAEQNPGLQVTWVVFSGTPDRAEEARNAARLFLDGVHTRDVIIHEFQDGYFPYEPRLKDAFESLKRKVDPDIVFSHYGGDLHQDHRAISQLTWNTFRDHLVLEYEIPKYDGGLGSPNVFVALSEAHRTRKGAHLREAFRSQRDKRWFSDSTFDALARIRGIECASPTGYAEAFYARKVLMGLGSLTDTGR